MKHVECIGMILAGGKGERLGSLTHNAAKPAVNFGCQNKIIDFVLSNCQYSGIQAIGVLTQYRASELHHYIGSGSAWSFGGEQSVVKMLPSSNAGGSYRGTANAVWRNVSFIEDFDPEHVLVLSGDHIYGMDYKKMLESHKNNNADVTIAAISVPWSDASRFGILSAGINGRVREFEEKPKRPMSNLASMGIYIFKWQVLKRLLVEDERNIMSSNDFGKDIIPKILAEGGRMFVHMHREYWRDVGTVRSLWESNMDLLDPDSGLDMADFGVSSNSLYGPAVYVGDHSGVVNSIVSDSCKIHGKVSNSVVCEGAYIGKGAEIRDSVIMPGVSIGNNAKICRAIIGENAIIGEHAQIGAERGVRAFVDSRICSDGVSLVGPDAFVSHNFKLSENSHIGYGWLLLHDSERTQKSRVVEFSAATPRDTLPDLRDSDGLSIGHAFEEAMKGRAGF